MPKHKSRRVDTTLKADAGSIYKSILRSVLQSSVIPDGERLKGYIRNSDYASLLKWSDRPSPQMYDSPNSYFGDCQVAALVKKYPFTPQMVPGLDPEATAVAKFLKSEHRCKRINQRARALRKRWNPNAQIYAYARGYIEKVLGETPDYSSILPQCDFTAGASLGVHGDKTNAMRKFYAKQWTSTPTALPYARAALSGNFHALSCILPGAIKCLDPDEFRNIVSSKVKLVDCNKITFVPKTALTYRSIAVEPLLNGYVQKGVDVHMRKKLRRVGIDLTDQRVNQALARAGSVASFNPFCTIDLASASDSLATEVVRDLLPPAWFEFLADIRSPWYSLNDRAVRYEKFCSMGNGFCFPLQTLIFSAICHAVGTHVNGQRDYDFSVYGDDIIVRQNVSLLVIEILRDIGFRVNTDKTFITGPFRESCGSDWYDGQDVRPVHLDKELLDIRQLFAFHNSTLRSKLCEDFFSEVRPHVRELGGKRFMRPGREPGDTCYSVPLDTFMGSSCGSWVRDGYRFRWREVSSVAVADTNRSLSREERDCALVYAVLRGSFSGKPYTVRYRSKVRIDSVCRHWYDSYLWVPPVINGGVRNVRKVVAAL